MSGGPDSYLRTLGQVALCLVLVLLGANTVRRASSPTGSSAFDDTMNYSQELVVGGVNVYAEYETKGTHSKYPPFFFLVFAPLALLELPLASGIFYVLSLALVWASLALAVYAFWHPGAYDPPTQRVLAHPALLALAVIVSNLMRGQVNILVLAFVCWGLWAFTRRRDLQAGFAVGIAVALKLTPLLLVVYFVWRRAWKAALGTTLALFLAWAVLPAVVFGPARAAEVTRSWVDVISGFAEQGVLGEGIEGVRHTNQSLSAAFYRFFTASPAGAGREDFYVNVAALDYETAAWIVRGLSVALLLALGLCVRGPPPDRRDVRIAYEASLVILVTLVISPISWINHYVVLIVPFAAALEGARRALPGSAARRRLRGAAVVSAILVTTAVWVFLMAFSLPLLGALVLALTFFVALERGRRPALG